MNLLTGQDRPRFKEGAIRIRRFLIASAAVGAALAFLTPGCAKKQRAAAASLATPFLEVPVPKRPAATAESVERGRRLYVANCIQCHGPRGAGDGFGARAAALAISAFAWFLFALLYDGAALALAGFFTGRAGARVLFVSVFGNPADLARVLALSICGTPHFFGAAGEAWSRFLGGAVAASLLAGVALLAWIALPLFAARRAIARRDL